ncbi:putative porin [Mucilaginibacter roseus]|uniref:Porin n=1 Tax=Mucilaginibacter roseus TaxID=1528868 RepID=A0ABS8U0Q3_9SPHI|nr:putative porin [Mucilaginibacter roseus]MCD8740683.1 putative porin [Mucilaginibacter roseus]
MLAKLRYILILLFSLSVQAVFAQFPTNGNGNTQYPGQSTPNYMRDTSNRAPQKQLSGDALLDTLRKREEEKEDSIVFDASWIRVSAERFMGDSTQDFALDTSLRNFENYGPLNQPRNPRISLGGYTGIQQRPLLFEPAKTIGFDVGLHSLDPYMIKPEDINYYRARVQYTNLFYVSGGSKEQFVKITHAQNVNPRLNVGFNLNFNGSKGFYSSNSVLRQNVSDVNAAFFTWYESKSKRYNMLANIIYNNLKAPESGAIIKNDIIFTDPNATFDKTLEQVRLPQSFTQWKTAGFHLKQSYFIGRIDSVKTKGKATVLPTQRVTHTFSYTRSKYQFVQNDIDTYNVFPDYYFSSRRSNDSLTVNRMHNDFAYSFYLRGKSAKNEAKLDLGLEHDLYNYTQHVLDTGTNEFGNLYIRNNKMQNELFQNITVKGRIGYSLSDRILLEGNVRQIVAGRDFGNFLYDAKLMIGGSNKVGRIILGAYQQNASPPLMATRWVSNHYIFNNSFNNVKTTNLSFNYVNTPLQLDLKAEYFLINDYIYFTAPSGGNDVQPAQLSTPINMIKVSLGKNLSWRKWHLDAYGVYQKTDYQDLLRTPEIYAYGSLYFTSTWFKVLYNNLGVSVRYNTRYVAPSYAVGLGQFYNGPDVTFSSYPVATAFFKGTIDHVNIFVQYDYVNQGLFSKGFYTVNRYPMQDALLKLGVSWTFFQ